MRVPETGNDEVETEQLNISQVNKVNYGSTVHDVEIDSANIEID